MAGEPKPGEVKPDKIKYPRATHLNISEPGKRNSTEMKGVTEESRMREKEWKKKMKMAREGKETDVCGNRGKPGAKRARRGSGDEKRQDVEERQVRNKSAGQGGVIEKI